MSREKRSDHKEVSDEKLDELMRDWSKVKSKISELEEREKSIKDLITNIMNDNKSDILTTENYNVKRRYMEKSTISKKDVPNDIWEKYSKISKYSAMYLKRL